MKTSVQMLLIVLCCALFLSGTAFSQGTGKKTTVAVLEFQSGGTLEKQEAYTLTNRFRALLVKTQAFQLIERDKMNDILKEQDFIISDNCNTSECVVQVGQLLGVESMIAGDIGKLGETYTIDLRMIEVQSGAVMQSQSRNHKGQIDGLLDVMQVMVNELAETVKGRATAKKYSLSINAILPAGVAGKKADIMIDGVTVGQNTVKTEVTEGTRKITVTAHDTDFTEYRKEINLKSDQKIDVKLEYSEGYKKRKAALELAQKQKAELEKAEREKKAAKELAKKENTTSGKSALGGPKYAFLSALVPGLGGYFVEKSKIRPAAATVTGIGLIGYGLMQKSKANDYYSDYKKSRDSGEKNSLYKKANSANHSYYIATRVGAAVWIADIIWVAYKGMQNDKKLKTEASHTPHTGLQLLCTGNQWQLGYNITF